MFFLTRHRLVVQGFMGSALFYTTDPDEDELLIYSQAVISAGGPKCPKVSSDNGSLRAIEGCKISGGRKAWAVGHREPKFNRPGHRVPVLQALNHTFIFSSGRPLSFTITYLFLRTSCAEAKHITESLLPLYGASATA